jgi:hypothetical protein
VATVLFLASVVCIKVWKRYATLEIDDATITLGDFAVQVTRLPTGATEADIRAHFSQFGEVRLSSISFVFSLCLVSLSVQLQPTGDDGG